MTRLVTHPRAGNTAGIVEIPQRAVVTIQERFIVEAIDLAYPARHKQENDPLGAGSKFRELGRYRAVGIRPH